MAGERMMLSCLEWGSVTELFQAGLATVAFWVAWKQWKRSCEVTRVEHLREMLCAFGDERVLSGFRDLIDRVGSDGKPVQFYISGPGGMPIFVSKECEQTIDKMLLTFSSICHEHTLSVIDDDEFDFFSYQIHRTLENRQVIAYLSDYVSFAGKDHKHFPFQPLIKEGAGVFPKVYGDLLEKVIELNKGVKS